MNAITVAVAGVLLAMLSMTFTPPTNVQPNGGSVIAPPPGKKVQGS